MSDHAGALALAEQQVAAVRDDPEARLALMAQVFHGPTGHAPQHLPFRRAALSFMRWQARRGVLNPLDSSPPGSVWWRAINERLLRDGCETVALLGGLAGEPSSQALRLWLAFAARPTARNWYRAHNASIVAGYLGHRKLAEAESAPERFFMNVALVRVMYAHALAAAPRLALGRFAPLGRLLGDPRLGMAGVFLSLRRVLPDRYPLARDVERYISEEQRLGRMLDYSVIVPRLQRLYEWSADELAEPLLLGLVRDGNPIYAWPFEERHVWRTPDMPFAGRVFERLTRPTALAESDRSQYEPMATHYQRPGWFTKNVFNPIVAGLTRLGVSLVGSRVLEVRGRKSGEWRRTPVNPLKYEGERYIVAARGETHWVRNLRASGEGRLRKGRRIEDFTATEVPDDEKLSLLRAYLKKWAWEVGAFFQGVGADAPDEDLRRIAPLHPVFRISRRL